METDENENELSNKITFNELSQMEKQLLIRITKLEKHLKNEHRNINTCNILLIINVFINNNFTLINNVI